MTPEQRRDLIERGLLDLEVKLLAAEIDYAGNLPTWDVMEARTPRSSRRARDEAAEKIQALRRAIPAIREKFSADLEDEEAADAAGS